MLAALINRWYELFIAHNISACNLFFKKPFHFFGMLHNAITFAHKNCTYKNQLYAAYKVHIPYLHYFMHIRTGVIAIFEEKQ